MNIDFPWSYDERGRSRAVDEDAHIRDLIHQVLFTAPGERVNRPDFGSGLMQLVFAPSGEALAAATQLTVHSALQQWLGDLILVQGVDVQSAEGTLQVKVDYVVRRTGNQQQAEFARSV
jgi:phage baseplate assembly protein W